MSMLEKRGFISFSPFFSEQKFKSKDGVEAFKPLTGKFPTGAASEFRSRRFWAPSFRRENLFLSVFAWRVLLSRAKVKA